MTANYDTRGKLEAAEVDTMAPKLVVVAMDIAIAALAETVVLAETEMATVEPAEMAAAMLAACQRFVRTGAAN